MVDRLERSEYVGRVVSVVEQRLCDQRIDIAPHIGVLAEQGALRYWLLNFADLVTSRWEVCEKMPIEKRHLLRSGQFSHSPSVPLARMTDLLEASQTDQWTSRVCIDILEYWDEHGNIGFSEPEPAPLRLPRRDTATNAAGISKRIVVTRTYLSRIQEVLLAVICRSFPLRWREPALPNAVDWDTRKKLLFVRPDDRSGSLEHCIMMLLPTYLPQTLIEHGDAILQFMNQRIRSVPAIIFTANLHVGSDSFLLWATYQRLKGSKIVCSQHGGLNGQGLVPTRGEEFERSFPDSFFHWGWSEAENAVKIPCQLLVWKRSRRSSAHRNQLLMITDCTFRHSRKPWSSLEDDHAYKQMLLDTYSQLPGDIKQSTTIRLHHDHDKYDDSHEEMWRAAFPDVRLDNGLGPIAPMQKRARLVVCTTLGTSEIVQIGQSIPTILRLHPDVHAIRATCAELFTEMEQVGLVHFSTESVQRFLELSWERIDDWWRSNEVETVRDRYLDRFGNRSERSLRHLRLELVRFHFSNRS
jgi:putative transferase (TIGR04331 family)